MISVTLYNVIWGGVTKIAKHVLLFPKCLQFDGSKDDLDWFYQDFIFQHSNLTHLKKNQFNRIIFKSFTIIFQKNTYINQYLSKTEHQNRHITCKKNQINWFFLTKIKFFVQSNELDLKIEKKTWLSLITNWKIKETNIILQ